MNSKIAVFVNGDNLYRFQRHAFWVDPKQLLEWISQNLGNITDAFYYMSHDPKNEKQQSFVRALPHLGYTPIARSLKYFEIEEDRGYKEEEPEFEFERANLNMEMACDLLTTDSHWDRAIFVFPSDDFVRPMQMIRARGKGVTVLAAQGFEHEIRSIAGSNYIDINDIKRYVERSDHRQDKKEFVRRD